MLVVSATAFGVLALAACSQQGDKKSGSQGGMGVSQPAAQTQPKMAAMGPMQWTVPLDGGSEVPPNPSAGDGSAALTYDDASNTLTWSIPYQNLTGPATAAHFHGPAAPGQNAGPQVDIGKTGLANPMEGSAELTDQQEADLKAGMWYINIHTAKYPDGEIRGQVMPAM
jgi:hypothetical protein